MLRTSHQTLLGVSFRNFVAAESLPAFESLWQRSRTEPSRGEVTLAAADGSQVAVHLTLNLLPSDDPTQTSVVITDLTEQKRHQEMVAAEAFARERAIELAEADRRKDEFLAMLAHELRNPLAPIRNGIDVLRILPPNGEQAKQILGMMEEQAHNLVRLIDDLLDVSRCGQGKLELRRQRVALTKIITNAIQTAQPLIHANGHELTVTQARESLHVYGDPTRLTQVVSNLLNNAARYTPRGGKILLTTERIGDEVAIRVKDNGTGIASDMLPHIFEMFVQADNSLNRNAWWTGNRPDPGEESCGNARRHRRSEKRRVGKGQRVHRSPSDSSKQAILFVRRRPISLDESEIVPMPSNPDCGRSAAYRLDSRHTAAILWAERAYSSERSGSPGDD